MTGKQQAATLTVIHTAQDAAANGNGLNDREEVFCLEYIKDLNATQAAIRVGYEGHNAHSCGARLLATPYIRTRVRQLMDERSSTLLVDAEFVVSSLVAVAQRCMQHEPVMKYDPKEKRMNPTGEYVFDSSGANKALELIGKHLGMFKERIEHSGEVRTGISASQFSKILDAARTNVQLIPGKGQ